MVPFPKTLISLEKKKSIFHPWIHHPTFLQWSPPECWRSPHLSVYGCISSFDPKPACCFFPSRALNPLCILPKPACCLLPPLLSQSTVPLISHVDSTNMEKTSHQSEESPQCSASIQHDQNEPSLHSIPIHTEYLIFYLPKLALVSFLNPTLPKTFLSLSFFSFSYPF